MYGSLQLLTSNVISGTACISSHHKCPILALDKATQPILEKCSYIIPVIRGLNAWTRTSVLCCGNGMKLPQNCLHCSAKFYWML